jgi:T3SS negative regulator,GrlR
VIEGLWVIKFLTPNDPETDLNGGVVVVETGRIFGGDSGYFYIGSIEPASSGIWNAQVRINRHDPDIVSVFGDTDSIELSGTLSRQENDASNRPIIHVQMSPNDNTLTMTAVMIRVADLP